MYSTMSVVIGLYGKNYKEHLKMMATPEDEGDSKIEVSAVIDNIEIPKKENEPKPASEQDTQPLSQSYEYESPPQTQTTPDDSGSASDDELYLRRAAAQPGNLVKIHRLIKNQAITLEELESYLTMRQLIVERTLAKK